ncbi:transposase [Amphritea pacifica]|uniref:transposase n=1 Tax=Amphritea pacifica TaxID=2811233 RepID=UPI00196379A4|nr:transposase [Amphritea pacifica]MBN1006601.1 transposase [Amphritea pacifica]
MPRLGRLVLPGYPHHIVQRGHNKQVVFAEDRDYQYYLNTLAEFKDEFQVVVHAYCLMTNHVHLLLEPETASGLGELMKRLAGRQTRYFNKQEGRRGTLWEGRYKSSVVDAENYFFACLRYIELNPVRAGMVKSPVDYGWSSYAAHYNGAETDRYTDNSKMKGFKGVEYESYICGRVDQDETVLLRESVNRNQLTGNSRFIDEIEAITGRRYERRGQGRPARVGS